MLELFLFRSLRPCQGHRVLYKALYRKFLYSLPPDDRPPWSRRLFTKVLWQLGFQTGIGNANRTYIINVSLDPEATSNGTLYLTGEERRIRWADDPVLIKTVVYV